MDQRTREGIFALEVNRDGGSTLAQQLAEHLRQLIDARRLIPGEALPATRRLSQILAVSRGTVVTAYEQLAAEGYLESNYGGGTRVNPHLPIAPPDDTMQGPSLAPRLSLLPETLSQPLPLTPGVSLSDVTGRTAWRKAWQNARHRDTPFGPAEGLPELRNAISVHLSTTRHSRRGPREILITAGAREGLSLTLTALFSGPGRTPVIGVEDPGYPSLRKVAARFGAQLVGLPVDGHGLVIDGLPDGLLDAVLVTPSHQYPAGGTLPLNRRVQLVDWATRRGVIIIEDDFDAALRYRGEPLPFLSELDNPEQGVVITAASFAPHLPAAVSIGYIVAPTNLRRQLITTRKVLGNPVAPAVQFVVSDLLANREIELLLSRQRQRLTRRHRLLTEVLAETDDARAEPRAGGINTVFSSRTPRAGDEATVLMRKHLLGPVAESQYWRVDSHDTGSRKFMVGLGGDDDRTFERAVFRLANLFTP